MEFWSFYGSHPDVDDAVGGAVISDHLGGGNYTGFVGQLVLMPVDPRFLEGVQPDAPGLVAANRDGTYAGLRGLAGFCIDSETAFRVSTNASDTSRYVAMGYAAAQNRYIAEGVGFYLTGGLRKAAYLLERFYNEAHTGGDIKAAALQSAIWEVLYDELPSVVPRSGNYYLRSDTPNPLHNSHTQEVILIIEKWFEAAIADNWGGEDYDPANRVIFWLDPKATNLNQSILTLNPQTFVLVPEPTVPVCMLGGFLLLCGRRRR